MIRSMKALSDASPIARRNPPTIFAGRPMVLHISPRLNVMRGPFRYALSLKGI
jgi:hypothetical protein